MIGRELLRQLRLKNEYEELMKINGKVIKIEPLGDAPYEKYRVTFFVRTIIGPDPIYRDKTVCILTLRRYFPDDPPFMKVDDSSMPQPWHPNWFESGAWDFGCWKPEDSLVDFIYRCARSLQFNTEMVNTLSVSNWRALAFWNENKDNSKIIPCDTQKLARDPIMVFRRKD